jgi:hypothetical protein
MKKEFRSITDLKRAGWHKVHTDVKGHTLYKKGKERMLVDNTTKQVIIEYNILE